MRLPAAAPNGGDPDPPSTRLSGTGSEDVLNLYPIQGAGRYLTVGNFASAVANRSNLPETGRSQPVDATLACSLVAGDLGNFEFPAHASGADETLVRVGLRSNRRRHNVALSGGICRTVWRHNTVPGGGIDCNQYLSTPGIANPRSSPAWIACPISFSPSAILVTASKKSRDSSPGAFPFRRHSCNPNDL
jgi:hypothetical protein